MINKINTAIEYVRSRSSVVPELCFVLGSGLGNLAEEIDGERIDYAKIPGFPRSTAPGHAGQLILGYWHGRAVVAMQGRVHLYEGYSPAEVVFPMRVVAGLGAKVAVLTNAAGGLERGLEVGDLVMVEDHLSIANLAGLDPQRGANDDRLGPRFVSMNGAYDTDLICLAMHAAASCDVALGRGTYAFVNGPSFETPAEVRFLQSLGCHLVGMSTVPEVIAARHMGLRVMVISAVSNLSVSNIGDTHITNEEEVWDAIQRIRPRLAILFKHLVPKLDNTRV